MKSHRKRSEETGDISERKGANRRVGNFGVYEIETWGCQRTEGNGAGQRQQARDVPAERQPFSPMPAKSTCFNILPGEYPDLESDTSPNSLVIWIRRSAKP